MCFFAWFPIMSNGTCAPHAPPFSLMTTIARPPKESAPRRSAKAQVSAAARRKAATKTTDDGLPVHSFRSLIADPQHRPLRQRQHLHHAGHANSGPGPWLYRQRNLIERFFDSIEHM